MGLNYSNSNQFPSHKYIPLNYKHCRVWANKIDNSEEIEQYAITVGLDTQHLYEKMFEIRLNSPNIISSMYFQVSHDTVPCRNIGRASILIERIAYRLSDFCAIPYVEVISVMYWCLKGYEILHKHYGLFVVKSTMVGITKNYGIKVWHHSNLSLPTPENQHCFSLLRMLSEIIEMVEKSSAEANKVQRFSEYFNLRYLRNSNFPSVLMCLNQYCMQNRIQISNQIPSIKQYVMQAEGKEPIVPTEIDSIVPKSWGQSKFSFKSREFIQDKCRKTVSMNHYTSRNHFDTAKRQNCSIIDTGNPKLRVQYNQKNRFNRSCESFPFHRQSPGRDREQMGGNQKYPHFSNPVRNSQLSNVYQIKHNQEYYSITPTQRPAIRTLRPVEPLRHHQQSSSSFRTHSPKKSNYSITIPQSPLLKPSQIPQKPYRSDNLNKL